MNIIYSLGLFFLFQVSSAPKESSLPVCQNPEAAKVVFRSSDGGQTWQDISEGLPADPPEDAIGRDDFFANGNGLYLRIGNGIYHSKPSSGAPFWEKENLHEQSSTSPGRAVVFGYNYSHGQFVQKMNGTSKSSLVYGNFPVKEIRAVFETSRGTVFIGSDKGLFRSSDRGSTWKQVNTDGIMKLAESNGVLMATNRRGIIRSTDGGENWENVLSEGGVGIAIERIEGGFAAINFNTESQTRRVRTSYDAGETWQPIDDGLPAQLSIASIVQVGKYFFCGHPAGIYRSSDKGKTWQLLFPSIENKVFNLSVSGDVIYAIPRSGGC